jgi:GT2 family glycosyltransferase
VSTRARSSGPGELLCAARDDGSSVIISTLDPAGGLRPMSLLPPFVTVVVPTFRRPDALDVTLTSLAAVEHPTDRLEVIVVDDGSGDETPEVVSSHPGVTFVRQENSGAAAARNRGARVARGDFVLFVDDDIVVETSHLVRHLAVHARHPRALINGEWEFAPATMAALQATPFGRYRLALEEEFRRAAPVEALNDGCFRCDVIPSQDLSLSRELFWEIGGFDEDFPAAGAEDQEFSLRARDAGCVLLRDPSIRLLHNDSRVTLEAFCRREERSAGTVPYLARRFPDAQAAVSYAQASGPVHRGDGAALASRKIVKAVLAREPILSAIRVGIGGLERSGAPDALLARAYSGLAGLHIFRGFRRALRTSTG